MEMARGDGDGKVIVATLYGGNDGWRLSLVASPLLLIEEVDGIRFSACSDMN